MLRGNREATWSASVGVPVELFDLSKQAIFVEVFRVAWGWSANGLWGAEFPRSVMLRRLTEMYDLAVPSLTDDIPVDAVPEVAAGIFSYVSSRSAGDGVYTFFDIGGGTLDGVAFRFVRETPNGPRINVLAAKVASLGAEVYHALSDELARAAFAKRVQDHTATVVLDAKKLDPAGWLQAADRASKKKRLGLDRVEDYLRLPIFFGGGGSLIPFFRTTIEATQNRGFFNANVPPFSLEDIPQPKELDMSACPGIPYSRYAVAYGLSIPILELPQIGLRYSVPTKKLKVREMEEVTKDVC